MPLIFYLLLIALLIGIGIRALSGGGLAVTMRSSVHGPYARPLGILFLALGLLLAGWLITDLDLAPMLRHGGDVESGLE